MTHKVEITAQAKSEVDAAYGWIRAEAPVRAAAWRQGLLDVAQTLERFPNRCPLAPESETLAQPIRQLLYGAYRILYMVEGDTVYVLHVRHGAREPLRPEDDEDGYY